MTAGAAGAPERGRAGVGTWPLSGMATAVLPDRTALASARCGEEDTRGEAPLGWGRGCGRGRGCCEPSGEAARPRVDCDVAGCSVVPAMCGSAVPLVGAEGGYSGGSVAPSLLREPDLSCSGARGAFAGVSAADFVAAAVVTVVAAAAAAIASTGVAGGDDGNASGEPALAPESGAASAGACERLSASLPAADATGACGAAGWEAPRVHCQSTRARLATTTTPAPRVADAAHRCESATFDRSSRSSANSAGWSPAGSLACAAAAAPAPACSPAWALGSAAAPAAHLWPSTGSTSASPDTAAAAVGLASAAPGRPALECFPPGPASDSRPWPVLADRCLAMELRRRALARAEEAVDALPLAPTRPADPGTGVDDAVIETLVPSSAHKHPGARMPGWFRIASVNEMLSGTCHAPKRNVATGISSMRSSSAGELSQATRTGITTRTRIVAASGGGAWGKSGSAACHGPCSALAAMAASSPRCMSSSRHSSLNPGISGSGLSRAPRNLSLPTVLGAATSAPQPATADWLGSR